MTASRFPVEEGAILQFARAIGDTNPVYTDPECPAAQALGGIIAPPTFVEANQHYDPDFAYHPMPGKPWFGSAADPSNGPPPHGEGGTAFHAETHIRFHRHLRPGDVLRGTAREGRSWTKSGRRGGELTFGEHIVSYVDQRGEPTVDITTVSVKTEHVVEDS